MQEKQNWRDILAEIVQNPKERQHILDELGIRPITISRWISGESFPRANKLHQLLNLYPYHREQFAAALRHEKGMDEFAAPVEDETPANIPSEFYTGLFETRAVVAENLYYWTLCDQILSSALGQLDPNRLGMSLWIARCMPPVNGKVRSLYESEGIGTPPWRENLEHEGMFLGAESLAGHVVTTFHYKIVNNLEEEITLVPVAPSPYEKSCAIFPILYSGRIAGVFSAASRQINYFSVPNRITLLQKYADLISLIFTSEDFYGPEQIELQVMPKQEKQKPFFARFNDLMRETIIRAAKANRPADKNEAERLVRIQLEEQLIAYAIENAFEEDTESM